MVDSAFRYSCKSFARIGIPASSLDKRLCSDTIGLSNIGSKTLKDNKHRLKKTSFQRKHSRIPKKLYYWKRPIIHTATSQGACWTRMTTFRNALRGLKWVAMTHPVIFSDAGLRR